ncbi:hypothetical protein, partial [Acinetobacter baumannii]|uniref:hypothetical protein n=1 Tax=Acinetobacter baumannii TaxID=470 RepID=UPI00207B7503
MPGQARDRRRGAEIAGQQAMAGQAAETGRAAGRKERQGKLCPGFRRGQRPVHAGIAARRRATAVVVDRDTAARLAGQGQVRLQC